MLKTQEAVIDAVEHWLEAIRAGDTEKANTIAASLPVIGSRLCSHPDFKRAAEAMRDGMDAQTALDGASWLLMCLTELATRDQQN